MSVNISALFIFITLLFAAGAVQAQTAGVVTLRANSTSAQGNLVPVLTWSTNPVATSCRASGGWSGNKAVSGNETLARINASTNYTLTCSWGSGSTRVSWTAPSQNTDGSALADLAGFRVFYSTSNTSFSQSTTLNDMSARSTTISALAPGTWYFKVHALNSRQTESADSNIATKTVAGATAAKTVSVTITGTPTPPPPPPPTGGNEVDPNDYIGQAQVVSSAGTTVNGTMSSSGDADYFRVSLPAGKKLTAVMTPNSNSDYELYLLDPNDQPVAWSENGKGMVETVTVTNSSSAAKTYYVRVTYFGGGTGSTNGKYSIRLSW